MLKKGILLGVLLSSVGTAPTLAGPCYFKSGFLAGAHVGVTRGSGTFKATFDTGVVGVAAASASGGAAKTSAMFGLVGGYRHILNGGYTVGADLAANIFANNELKKQLDHTIAPDDYFFVNRLSRRFNIIPGVSFGKILCDRWLVSLGVGLAISRFQQQVFSVDSNVGLKSSVTKVGFAPSLGVEYAATQNLSVVGGVTYEIYGKISKKFGNEFTAPYFITSSYATSINPRYLTLKVGAVYRF